MVNKKPSNSSYRPGWVTRYSKDGKHYDPAEQTPAGKLRSRPHSRANRLRPKILSYLKENGPAGPAQISRGIGESPTPVSMTLEEMEAEGLLKKRGRLFSA